VSDSGRPHATRLLWCPGPPDQWPEDAPAGAAGVFVAWMDQVEVVDREASRQEFVATVAHELRDRQQWIADGRPLPWESTPDQEIEAEAGFGFRGVRASLPRRSG